MILHGPERHPIPQRDPIKLLLALAQRLHLLAIEGQPDVAHIALSKTFLFVVHVLGPEHFGHSLAGRFVERDGVRADGGLAAAHLLAPADGVLHARVRRGIDSADELQVGHVRTLSAGRQRVGEREPGPRARDEAVGGGQRGADEVLVAGRHVEDGAAPRHQQPLVAVGHEEVRVQRAQVERDVADAVRPVHQR